MFRVALLVASAKFASSRFLAPAAKLAADASPDAATDADDDDSLASATVSLNVTLEKSGPLGMRLEESVESDGLTIQEIQASGLVAKYNEGHPSQKIVQGMDIVEVNGATDSDAIGDQMSSAKHLVMRLEKTTMYRRHCDANKTAELLKSKDVVWKPKKAQSQPKVTSPASPFDEIDAQLAATDQKSLVDNEEFLLGLLIMHHTSNDWIPEQYLDAVCDLAHDSPMITYLYWHHNDKEPLAAQLAAMMDEERKGMAPTQAPPMLEPGDFSGVMNKMMSGVAKHGAVKQ